MTIENQFKDALEESLDKNFPKGKCKERGAALVLFADAVMACRTALQAYGDEREWRARLEERGNTAYEFLGKEVHIFIPARIKEVRLTQNGKEYIYDLSDQP